MVPQKIGRYEIRAELGRGGMATVYRAYDPRFKREVALKVLPSQFTHDPQFRARFEREAQTIAALEHFAIVPVYDFGEDPDSEQPYIVMRLMTGGSLAERLENGPVSPTETARILQPLASALDKAHAQGVIHRDLKPGNILFDAEGKPYLSDFGIVKLSEATASFTGSAVIGTPAYMSPEQVRGEGNLDGRSDIYALGVIVFQMLTGELPYKADTPMALAVKHITEPAPKILETQPDLPSGCDNLIQKAMAKNRDERYATANGLAGALVDMAAVQPGRSSPTLKATVLPETLLARPDLTSRKWRWGFWGLIGIAGFAILAVGASLWFNRSAQVPMSDGLLVTASHTPPYTPSASPSPTVPTLSPTASATATITLTPTRRPTRTATPLPAWVTDFADPIRNAIAGRQPDFQDDFKDKSGGWSLASWCANMGYTLYYGDGGMGISGYCWVSREMWYPDFLAEFDYHYLPGGAGGEPLVFNYRHLQGGADAASNYFKFFYNGMVEAGWVTSPTLHRGDVERTQLPGAARTGTESNHVLVIAQGQSYALYVNGQPVFYREGEPIWANGAFQFDMENNVAIDNFKVWDISDLAPDEGGGT